MLWLFVPSGLVVLVLLFFARKRSERAIVKDWGLLLTPKGNQIYGSVEERVRDELKLMTLSLDQAHVSHGEGALEDAIKLVEVGYKVIERFSPNMLKLLATMAVFSRMVSAMIPMEPLRPSDFRIRQIVSLAYLSRVLHAFLVSAGERFRLRLYVIGHGFGVAMRYFMRACDRIVRGHSEDEREWESISAVQADLQALSEESLRSFRVLLASLGPEHGPDVIQRFQP
jgi:hypothetical protein